MGGLLEVARMLSTVKYDRQAHDKLTTNSRQAHDKLTAKSAAFSAITVCPHVVASTVELHTIQTAIVRKTVFRSNSRNIHSDFGPTPFSDYHVPLLLM